MTKRFMIPFIKLLKKAKLIDVYSNHAAPRKEGKIRLLLIQTIYTAIYM